MAIFWRELLLLMGASNADGVWKKLYFLPIIISEMIHDRVNGSYLWMPIGTHIWFIKWCHFQWLLVISISFPMILSAFLRSQYSSLSNNSKVIEDRTVLKQLQAVVKKKRTLPHTYPVKTTMLIPWVISSPLQWYKSWQFGLMVTCWPQSA